jgi:MSHA biogenesis protein MshL
VRHTGTAVLSVFACLLLAACGTRPIQPVQGHIVAPEDPAERIAPAPPPVRSVIMPPPPRAQARAEKYSVVVSRVKVQDLLYALARDAKVNIDIHPGIEGNVTLNAIDQSLPQILQRISRQVDMRFEYDGQTIVVMPDTPFLRTYHVDYVNMSRATTATSAITTQVQTGGTTTTVASGGGGAGTNNATTNVTSNFNNKFWDTLTANLKDLLRETDKILPNDPGSPAPSASGSKSAEPVDAPRVTFREAASIIVNPETGIISVRATSRQHEKVQEFLDQVQGSARRQVLIEATIVEVTLSDQYRAGVDWQRVATSGSGFAQQLTGSDTTVPTNTNLVALTYQKNHLLGWSAAIKLLDTYGTTRVLSSPKLMALNNQTALLKVVDNLVYFSVESQTTSAVNSVSQTNVTTTAHSVSVGFVMSVTPQISDTGTVTLVVRPTISSVTDFKQDPNPSLVVANSILNQSGQRTNQLTNAVPEIQVREMESLLRVDSGQVAVLGGLMQDRKDTSRNGIPGLSQVPGLGDAFSYRNDQTQKIELVIFLRPIVINNASLDADLRDYRKNLPQQNFFKDDQAQPSVLRQRSTLGGGGQ